MEIILSKHAEERIASRNLKDPRRILLQRVGSKTRRKIRKWCKVHKTSNDFVYFNDRAQTSIFVLKQIDVNKYLCVTVLRNYK